MVQKPNCKEIYQTFVNYHGLPAGGSVTFQISNYSKHSNKINLHSTIWEQVLQNLHRSKEGLLLK